MRILQNAQASQPTFPAFFTKSAKNQQKNTSKELERLHQSNESKVKAGQQALNLT